MNWQAFTLATAFALAPLAASAEEHTVRVHYSVKSAQTEAGIETLYNRLNIAAGKACGASVRSNRIEDRECMREALDQAVASSKLPALAARHEEAVRLADANTSRRGR